MLAMFLFYFFEVSFSNLWIGISCIQAYKKVGNLVKSWLVPAIRFSSSPKWVAATPSWAQTIKSPSQLDFLTSAAGGQQFVFSSSSSCQMKKEAAGWISENERKEVQPEDSVQWLSAANCLRRIRKSRSQSTGVNLKGPQLSFSSRTQVDQFCKECSLKKHYRSTEDWILRCFFFLPSKAYALLHLFIYLKGTKTRWDGVGLMGRKQHPAKRCCH